MCLDSELRITPDWQTFLNVLLLVVLAWRTDAFIVCVCVCVFVCVIVCLQFVPGTGSLKLLLPVATVPEGETQRCRRRLITARLLISVIHAAHALFFSILMHSKEMLFFSDFT